MHLLCKLVKQNPIQLILFILFNSNTIYSQISIEWEKRFSQNQSSIENGNSVIVDKLNNVYVTGSILENNNYKIVTLKYTRSGKLSWERFYDGGYDLDLPTKIVIDSKNSIYIAGTSDNENANPDFVIIKYSSEGNEQWVRRFNGTGSDDVYPTSMVIDSSDNIYITGKLSPFIVTLKYDADGNLIWNAFEDAPFFSNLSWDLTTNKEGNTYIAGSKNNNLMIIKYSTDGNKLWERYYDGPYQRYDEAIAIGIDDSGYIYAGGNVYNNLGITDFVIVKFNQKGDLIWAQLFNGSANYIDIVNTIKVTKNGTCYLSGYSTESSTGYDFRVIKYNSNGIEQWKKNYNRSSNDFPHDLALDENENIFITGETNEDCTTIKYDSSGQLQWSTHYNYSGEYYDDGRAILTDYNGSVIVVGTSNRDIITLKYSKLTGLITGDEEIPENFSLSQNYPNPFNPTTTIEFSLSLSSFVTLKVFDVMGKEVEVLIAETKPSGVYRIKFNSDNLNSGIYYYQLKVNNNSETKKMVLLK